MNEGYFKAIKKEYDNYYTDFLKRGKLPMKDTGIGFWNAASSDDVYEFFKKMGLHKYKSFIDLGSGDGKVVLIASLFGVNAAGVEIDENLHNKAEEMRKKFGVRNAVFYNKDFHEHNISDYDIVFVNPDRPMYRGMEKKLFEELKGRLIVYGHHFHPTMLKKLYDMDVNGNYVAVYSK